MQADVKKTWDACGGAFDLFTTAQDSFAENIERPAIAQLIGNLSGAKLLDLGCGSGTYSAWFAQQGARVTGLDLSAVMISIARRKALDQGLHMELQVADISKPLPFSSAEFDVVFTATALHYVEDISSAMVEAARVVKPGGRLIASVLHPMATARFPVAASADWAAPDYWEARYFGEPARSIETPWLGFGEVPNEGRRIFSYHHTVSEYFGALAGAGLTVTDIVEPAPPAEFAARNSARYDEAMDVPVYLIFKAEKRK